MFSGTIAIVTTAVLVLSQPLDAPPEAREITYTRGRAFVPVWLNGVGPYPFLVDTAAAYVALDVPIAQGLALPETGEAEHLDGFSAQKVQVQALEVAGRPAISCQAYATEMSRMESTFGLRVAGVLGLPGLPKRFRLDLEGHSIGRFPAEMGAEWLDIPLDIGEDSVMRVRLSVDGEHVVQAVVDTVFAGTLSLRRELLEEWGVLAEETPRIQAVTAQGIDGATQLRLTEFTLGPVTVKTPLCEVTERDEGPRIGTRFLSRFDLAVDREAKKLYLRPLVGLPWTDPPVYGVGLTPAERRDELWSLFIAEGSPADLAGVSPGDRLVSVNGFDMAGQPFDFVQQSLSGAPGAILDVEVLRGTEVLVFRLATEEAL